MLVKELEINQLVLVLILFWVFGAFCSMHIWNKMRNGATVQQARIEVIDGIEGVLKEEDVEVGVIS